MSSLINLTVLINKFQGKRSPSGLMEAWDTQSTC